MALVRLLGYILQGHKTNVRFVHSSANLPNPPSILSLTPEHEREARAWLNSFRVAATVPKHLVELSFSRSSGPGGQVEYLIAPRTALEWERLEADVLNRTSTKFLPR
ncbi:hypothetical protein JVT61DRAFT_11751 [Boletus reticuloceps]|uniref:Uncharacterized protein n=1 Tax=Boletus reticuloceps TaxID=495285 RepID=A0A8I3AED4_9AGAM|nr:hypothetical protein JVT61DRAFT_11751 [Boletus reticuloceps]